MIGGFKKQLERLARIITVSGLMSLAVVLFGSTSAMAANSCTWTGATNTFWGTASNWSGCGGTFPQNGDSLVFNTTFVASPSNGLLYNDISDLQVSSILFTGSGMYGFNITGDDISLNASLADISDSSNNLNLTTTLTNDATFTVGPVGLLNLGSSSNSLTIGNHSVTVIGGRFQFEGPIIGTGTINFNTSTTANFMNGNSPSFSGPVKINGGRMIINAADEHPLGTGPLTISYGGILQESFNTASTYTLSNDITMEGDGGGNNGAINLHDFTGGTSTLTLTGNLTLTGDAKIDLDNANMIVLSRPTGCGSTITKSGGSSGSGGSLTGNLTGSCSPGSSTNYTWTQQTQAPSADWQGIAGSKDGKYLVTAVYNGHIWTSSDYGATWTDRSSAGTRNWVNVASSGDGTHLAAVVYGGNVWISNDHGASWTDVSALGAANWVGVTYSKDGSHMAVNAFGGDVWTSTNYGATWTDRSSAGTRNWASLASSDDGSHLFADVDSGYLYTSADYGATWTAHTSPGTQTWNFVASSADGSHLAATVFGGFIWISSDYGATWTASSAGYANWQGVAMSSNGKYLVALESGGVEWTSSDYGATWVDPPGNQSWYGVFMSANGSRIAATSSPGRIWTAYDPAIDIAEVLAPKTGYGAPSERSPLSLVMFVLSLLGVGGGLWILHQQAKSQVN